MNEQSFIICSTAISCVLDRPLFIREQRRVSGLDRELVLLKNGHTAFQLFLTDSGSVILKSVRPPSSIKNLQAISLQNTHYRRAFRGVELSVESIRFVKNKYHFTVQEKIPKIEFSGSSFKAPRKRGSLTKLHAVYNLENYL